jgi:hypothetical protein
MAEIEQFSFDHYTKEWVDQRDSVTVEGALQDDGDFYVIDRNPRNPSTLIRVRKKDLVNFQKTRKVTLIGRALQFYRISIKRGVPVQTISVVESDRLSAIVRTPRDVQIITAHFENSSTLYTHTYKIKDVNANVIRVPAATLGPGEHVDVELQTLQSGRYGDAKYWHEDQDESDGSEVQLVEEGQTVQMIG